MMPGEGAMTLPAAGTVLLLLAIAGCGGSGSGQPSCQAQLLAGDLVITEIMANPQDRDEGKEWFEIYNRTANELDLTGVRVSAARADGSGEMLHVIGGANVASGDYLVLGGMLAEVKPDYVDYTYGADLGGLRNSGGSLALHCGQALVDRVVYLEASDGVSLQFDGSKTPDSIANDDDNNWCDARTEYDPQHEPGSLGSPGLPNQACASDIPPTSCKDGEAVRDVVPPQVGDLVITEFMANPAAAGDTTGEWFEVQVNRDIDLNGLQLGKAAGQWDTQLAALECLPVKAGTHLVFARSADSQLNGGLPRVDGVFGFALANSGGGLAIGYGTTLLDAVTYSSSRAGESTALEPTLTDPEQNDNESYWCPGQQPYGAGDLGSPGAPNPDCAITPEGKCREGGNLRDQRLPQAGDLVITEVMANPDAAPDASGEWFELYVARDIDINNLQIGKTAPEVVQQLPGGDCLAVAAGSYVVFAASQDAGQNGHLPQADFPLEVALTNSGGGLFVGFAGQVIDAVTYPAASKGASTMLDPGARDASANDNPDNWCTTPAGTTYGDGDRGTPGQANPACP